MTVQEFTLPNFYSQKEYWTWFESNMHNDLLDLPFYSNEPWFHLSGVDSQNFRIRSSENPQHFVETSLIHSIEVSV